MDPPPIIYTELFRDASDFEWVGVFETKPAGGAWSKSEKEYHINERNSGIEITDFQTPDKTSDTIKYLPDILKIHWTS